MTTDDEAIDWGLALDLGDNWVPLPLDQDPVDFGTYALEVLIEDAPTVLGRQMSREVAEAIGEELTVMTAHAQRTGAYAASLYRPIFDGPTVAMLEAHVHPPVHGRPLREWIETEYDDLGSNHELDDVRLPIGDALRLWQVSGRPSDEVEAVVVEAVVHFFEAPGGEIIRLGLSWTAPAFSGELQQLADKIVADVAFQ